MRDLFTKDLGWKIFSVALAAAIWFTVNGILHESATPLPDASIKTITYDNLSVTLVAATADVRAYRLAHTTVKVTVTGPAAVMATLQAGELHATVNVTGASLANGLILPVEISLPPKVAIVAIEPDRVLVTPPTAPGKK